MIYADNAATTVVKNEIAAAMIPWLINYYGNPSSQYEFGRKAKAAIDYAREIISDKINCLPEEIIFTSCGSEANTQAIMSIALTTPKDRSRIVSDALEHKSVLHTLECIAPMKEVVMIDPTNFTELSQAIHQNAAGLVSIMAVNNEVGLVNNLEKIGGMCSATDTPFHTDAVQAFCKIPIDVQTMDIDLLSASGHKIHAPKGVGFLYVNRRYHDRMSSIIQGGGQEGGLRPGTENVASIVGLGVAVELSHYQSYTIGDHFKVRFEETFPKAKIIGHGNIYTVCMEPYGLRSEQIIEYMDEHEICISSGSACDAGSGTPSHVLKALGYTDSEALSSVRLSFDDEFNTMAEVDEIIKVMQSMVDLLC